MNTRTSTLTINRLAIVTFAVLLGIATAAPLVGNQFITGTIVNATLIIATVALGVRNGLLLGLIPSSIALASGLLPALLSPMIPFIILGNAALVVAFDYFGKKNYWLGMVTGSILKFGIIFGTSSIVTNMIVSQQVAAKVAVMMSWPQMVTAFAGGLVAYGFLRATRKSGTGF